MCCQLLRNNLITYSAYKGVMIPALSGTNHIWRGWKVENIVGFFWKTLIALYTIILQNGWSVWSDKSDMGENNVTGRDMFEYRQLALWNGLAWGSEFICELMKLWSQFFIVWVQNSLLIGHAGYKVFTDLSLVCFVSLCSVSSGQQICNFIKEKIQEKEKRIPLQVSIFLLGPRQSLIMLLKFFKGRKL